MKRKLLICFLAFFISAGAFAQNAIVGSGFAPGWGGGGCPTGNSNFEYFSSSVGSSYIRTEQANGTGTQYFRLGIDWGGTTGQYTITSGSDVAITEGTGYTLGSGCTTSGSMTVSVSSTSHNYIFKTADAGSSPSMKLVYFKVEGTVRTVSSVSQSPTDVFVGNDVVVTATLSGSFSTGQAAWLHYTTDNWSTSSLTKMSGSGTTYSATISSITADDYRYRVITSGDIGSISGSDADWYAINANDNTGSDYTFTPTYGNVAFGVGGCDGNWSTAACWENGSVPGSGVDITISEDITLNQDATVANLTINSSKTLSISGTRTLTISNGGTIANSGSFNTGSDLTVDFAGSATISGTTSFNAVVLNGGVNFGSNSNIKASGSLQINSGGFVNTNAPTYASNSTLIYNTGGTYGRSSEWSYSGTGTSGTDQGYPGSVTVSNSTTLDIPNGATAVARAMAGSLTIENGSTVSMGAMTAGLTVSDAITINNGGTLTLSSVAGGDVTINGSFANNGTFNNNGRQISFDGSSTQTISGTLNASSGTSNNFSFLRINNSNNSAGVGVSLSSPIYVANQVTLTDGVLILNGSNLVMSSSATFSGLPSWGSTSSNFLVAEGSGKLIRQVSTSGTTVFPIGTESAFMPMRLQLSSGSPSDFELNMVDPSGVTDTSYSLYHTWDVSGSGTIDMDVQWPDSEEGTNFPTSNLSFLKKTGSTWSDLSYTATRNGSDPYNASFSSVSCCSQFMPGGSAALPVDLVEFKGVRLGENTVSLQWVTAMEIDNEGFKVERSENGVDFKSLTFIPGAGNYSGILTYQYEDLNVNAKMNFYRLIQVDFNGVETVYGPVVIKPLESLDKPFEIYPNPFKQDIIISLPMSDDEEISVELTNHRGQVLMSQMFNNKADGIVNFNTSSLPEGIYFIKTISNGTTWVRKVVKI